MHSPPAGHASDSIAIVREPVARYLSAFNNKVRCERRERAVVTVNRLLSAAGLARAVGKKPLDGLDMWAALQHNSTSPRQLAYIGVSELYIGRRT